MESDATLLCGAAYPAGGITCIIETPGRKSKPTPDIDAYKADNDARKAADRNCPNDGAHNLIRDANDETKWVCVQDK
jgi:hypothetical protein